MGNRGQLRAFTAERPPLWLGAITALSVVAMATALIYPLEHVAPAVSLSVVYLPGVLLVSAYWGLALGFVTALLSAAAFNFFHIPPVGEFTIADSRNWVALAAFTLVAGVVSTIAELARSRAQEADRRRAEADLAAGLARDLLAGESTAAALGATSRRLSAALSIPSATVVLGAATVPPRRTGLELLAPDDTRLGTLLVPDDLSEETLHRLRAEVAPTLAALVAIALHRDAMQAEAVETAALRRSDELKTALLRAVSHDLRTPVTAILAAGHALTASSLTRAESQELTDAVVEEGERLSGLIDKLLDLSLLQSGRATPRQDWISLEEVAFAARDAVRATPAEVDIVSDRELPQLRADAGQLEQAFVNLLENARRYGEEKPVSVRLRRSGDRAIVRVVDQGPGIDRAEQERIFEPFYRGSSTDRRRWVGSGLGLAIVKGFVEANGGTIAVESLPGQGTTFVIELPLGAEENAPKTHEPAAVP